MRVADVTPEKDDIEAAKGKQLRKRRSLGRAIVRLEGAIQHGGSYKTNGSFQSSFRNILYNYKY
jgi:hypothetical protein